MKKIQKKYLIYKIKLIKFSTYHKETFLYDDDNKIHIKNIYKINMKKNNKNKLKLMINLKNLKKLDLII